MIRRFLRDLRGTASIEHGLIALLLSFAILGGLSQLASSVDLLWDARHHGPVLPQSLSD